MCVILSRQINLLKIRVLWKSKRGDIPVGRFLFFYFIACDTVKISFDYKIL
jgi:uncharacterized membrane protein